MTRVSRLEAKRQQKSSPKHTHSSIMSKVILGSASILLLIPIALLFYAHSRNYKHPVEIAKLKPQMVVPPKEIKPTLQAISTPSASFVIPILMYHYVEIVQDKRDTIRQSLDIAPSTLTSQIETLKKAEYTFMTMAQIGDVLSGKMQLPSKPIVLTFDDGYRDFYTDVLPILKKENVKAVAYIVPGFYDKPNYMFRWQIYELANSGLVEIAAHTVHHAYLKGLPGTIAKKEIEESKKILEDTVHIPVVSFAYPYGAFDPHITPDLVKQAGFTTAVSTIPGIYANNANRFFLHRIRPGMRVNAALTSYLESLTKLTKRRGR